MKFLSYIFNSSTPKNARLFFVRFCALALVAAIAQFAMYYGFDQDESKLIEEQSAGKYAPSLSDLRVDHENGLEVLFFGDSTTVHLKAIDPSTIHETTGELLASKLENNSIHSVCSMGLRLDIFELMYQYSMSTTDRIDVLVLPINIRTFGPPSIYNPANQFRRFKTALILGRYNVAALLNPALSFNAMKSVTPSLETLQMLIADAAQDHRLPNPSVRQMVYDFTVPRDHPLLKSVASIRQATRESGTELVLYTTPINYSYIRKTFGREVELITRRNLRSVITLCELQNITVLDLSEALPEEFIVGIEDTASHLRGEGRDEVARLIADALQKQKLVD